MANYQKQQTITHLKKVYSVLSQGFQTALADDNPDAFGVTLNDGTFLLIQRHAGAATSCTLNIYADLNGPKSPNKMGRDVFAARTSSAADNRVTALKQSDISVPSECEMAGGTYKGISCLEKIINDGWEIRDDYPW